LDLGKRRRRAGRTKIVEGLENYNGGNNGSDKNTDPYNHGAKGSRGQEGLGQQMKDRTFILRCLCRVMVDLVVKKMTASGKGDETGGSQEN